VKILLCHNYYRYRGGEDVSFEADVEMLRSFGHEVCAYTKDNLEIESRPSLSLGKNTIWNGKTEKEVADIIDRFHPDVLHCNNVFPQISPSVYRAANRRGVAVVQALRNYRLLCANGYFFRDGSVCTKCVGKSIAYPALIHACYRQSRPATAAVVGMQMVHAALGTWKNRVDMFFTPSAFSRSIFVGSGIDADQIAVRTNFVHPNIGPGDGNGGFALFIGRISPEKGLPVLLKAWEKLDQTLPLKIVGRGPDEERLRREFGHLTNVEWLGQRSTAEALALVGDAKCLIMPSEWFETFGRTIAESFSRGTPVIASRLGAMAELVSDGESGYLFESSNPDSLVAAVQKLCVDQPCYQSMRKAAYDRYIAQFTRERSYEQLMSIYNSALEKRHRADGRLGAREPIPTMPQATPVGAIASVNQVSDIDP